MSEVTPEFRVGYNNIFSFTQHLSTHNAEEITITGTDDSETTVTVEENPGEDEADDGDGDGTEDGDGESGDEQTPDMTVTVEYPQPGQTLVIDEGGASIRESGEGDAENGDGQEDDTEDGQDDADDSQAGDADGDDAGSGSSGSNIRANRLTVDINTDQDFRLSVTTYEDDLTRSTAIEAGTQSARIRPLARGASMMKINTAPAQTEGGLTIEAATESEAASGTTPADETEGEATVAEEPGDSGLPVGPVAALVVSIAVVLAGGLWWRQRQ